MLPNDIKLTISRIPGLPAMPTVVAEALNIIKNPNSNINELSGVISKDMSLTSQILKLVNSAYYGFPQQITTINKAMALLGLNKIKSLIMSVALKPMLMSNGGKALWEHSIRCAVACEHIAKSLNTLDPDEAFVVGLLHDVGKSVLEIYNASAVQEVDRLSSLGAERLAVEKMMFGFDHTDAGSELVRRWQLPEAIINSVRYHHSPQRSRVHAVVGIVYVADRVTQEPIKYPIIDSDIANFIDFELPDPMLLREEVFEKSQAIIMALSK